MTDAQMDPASLIAWPVESPQVLPAPDRLHERLHRAAPQPLSAIGAPGGRQRIQFFYELLAISRGRCRWEKFAEFSATTAGSSSRSGHPLGLRGVSIHTATLRLLPRQAIGFACGASGVVVQLLSTALLMGLFNLAFQQALPVAVITAASSNYLVNNALTFRDRRQSGRQLIRGC